VTETEGKRSVPIREFQCFIQGRDKWPGKGKNGISQKMKYLREVSQAFEGKKEPTVERSKREKGIFNKNPFNKKISSGMGLQKRVK